MSNLDTLFKNRSFPQIKTYQSAIRNIRKNARTKGEKIQAIKRQTNYMNLMFNSGSELGGQQGIDASYFLKGDLGLSSFKKADVDYIFSALNVPYTKTKSSILGNVKDVYNVMRYLEFTQPAPAGPVTYTHPQAAAPIPYEGPAPPAPGPAPAMRAVPLWRRRGAHPHLSNEPGGVPRAPIPAAGYDLPDPRLALGPVPPPMMMKGQRRPNPYISNKPGGLHARAPIPAAGMNNDIGEAIAPVHMRRALLRFPREPDPDLSNDPGGLAPGRGPAIRRSAPRGGSLPRPGPIAPRVGGPQARGGSARRASGKRKQRSGSPDVAVSSAPQRVGVGFDPGHPIDLGMIHDVENDDDLFDDLDNDNVASEHESDQEELVGIEGPGKTIHNPAKDISGRSGSKGSRSGSKRRARSPSPMGPLETDYHLKYSKLTNDQIKEARARGMLVGSKSRGNILRYKDLSSKEQKEWDKKPNVEARKRFMKQCAANREAVGKMSMIEKSNKRLGGADAMMS